MSREIETQLTRVSEWVVGLRFEDVPAPVVTLARMQLLDIIAAICAGAQSEAGLRVRRALESLATPGPCPILPDGAHSWSASDAVYLHAALANALELDNLVFMGHVGQSAVTVPLALAQVLQADGKDLLTAQIAAVEVAGRMGAYLASGPQQGHMRAYLHRAAGSVAAAKLLGLNPKATACALATALSTPEFPLYPAAFSPDTKVVCTSAPAVEGMRAAFLAASGFDAALDVIEHPAGFLTFFSYARQRPAIWAHIGETWSLQALSCKPYAACAYAQGPVAAALQIRQQPAFSPEAIRNVVVDAPLTTVAMESFSKPHKGAGITPVNTHFSTRRSVAATLLFGAPTGAFFQPDRFRSCAPSLTHLAEQITLRHDWQMTVDLIQGIDTALEGAGYPGVLGMGQTHKTLAQFKQAFGSQRPLSWRDVPDIWRLPSGMGRYLLKRYWRGYWALLPRWGRSAVPRFNSYERDLSRFAFRQAGRVTVHLADGQRLVATCRVPPGFAGDPGQARAVREKYERETTPVWGKTKAERLQDWINHLPDSNIADLKTLLTLPSGGRT